MLLWCVSRQTCWGIKLNLKLILRSTRSVDRQAVGLHTENTNKRWRLLGFTYIPASMTLSQLVYFVIRGASSLSDEMIELPDLATPPQQLVAVMVSPDILHWGARIVRITVAVA